MSTYLYLKSYAGYQPLLANACSTSNAWNQQGTAGKDSLEIAQPCLIKIMNKYLFILSTIKHHFHDWVPLSLLYSIMKMRIQLLLADYLDPTTGRGQDVGPDTKIKEDSK
jgi:hypothetical protein